MNSFLQHLVERSVSGAAEPLRPRLPGRFESLTTAEPRAVEPLLPEHELVEEARPWRAPPPVQADQETESPRAASRPGRPADKEPPAPPPVALEVDQQPPRQPVGERSGEGEQKAHVRRVYQGKREAEPKPPARVDARSVSELPPDRRSEGERELERAPVPAESPRVATPQPTHRSRRVDDPAALEGPAITVASEPQPRREEPEIRRPADVLVPPVAPPVLQPARRSAVEQPPAPRVQVSIGRVEVRAVFAPPPAAPPRPRPAPAMSLDDYLKQRDGGGQ